MSLPSKLGMLWKPLTCSADHSSSKTSKLRLCGYSRPSLSLRSDSNVGSSTLVSDAHRSAAKGTILAPGSSADLTMVTEWHAELDQHKWARRLTCCEPDALPFFEVPLATVMLMTLPGPPLLALTRSSTTSTSRVHLHLRQLWGDVRFSFTQKRRSRC